MKRIGNLIEHIAAPDTLREAYLRAARGKRHQPATRAFAANLDAELTRIREGLLSAAWAWGPYHRFRVYDPKERIICAAPFPDRVAQHAMMMACDASFDAYQIYDSYACRRGKGLDGALARARRSRQRFKAKLSAYHAWYENSVWDEHEIARHVDPLIAFVRRASSDTFPRRVMVDLGLCPRARTA